jgi:hypothetical protein
MYILYMSPPLLLSDIDRDDCTIPKYKLTNYYTDLCTENIVFFSRYELFIYKVLIIVS